MRSAVDKSDLLLEMLFNTNTKNIQYLKLQMLMLMLMLIRFA